jgi:parvulin-like peptidyl-prolyl isomerase
MRFQYLVFVVCLAIAGLAYGQVAPAAAPSAAGAKAEASAAAAPEKAPEVKVGPDDAVITLKGLCSDASLQGEACKTVITRAQFEKLADALQPKVPPANLQRLASLYAQILRTEPEAEKRGLDKGPRFEEMMRFARLQILYQELIQTLQEESGKVSDGDIEDYYKKNESSYEQATLARIYIPKARQIAPAPVTPKAEAKADVKAEEKTSPPQPPTEEQKKAAEEAMTKLATDLRARAVKGEDPDTLQKEAWAAAGLKGTPPSTKMENKRRATLPPNQQAVMDLKPGEVSEVITDPSGLHYVYKMIGKETIPLDTVKQDIQRAISRERLADSMKGFQGNVDLNNAYFAPVPRPGIMGGRMPVPPAQAPKHD